MRCFIFAAGDCADIWEWPRPDDYVIAADAGYLTCQVRGIVPDLLTGDFDSMDNVPENFPNVIRLPVEKDDTDTLFAARKGLEQGCDEFHLYGCAGGTRLDHTLANLQTLLFLRRHGARGFLYDRNFMWTAIENESLTIQRQVERGLLSIFCLGSQAKGVDEIGLQYPLHNAVLTPDFPLGVSNHFQEPEATVRVRDGALLVGWEVSPGSHEFTP